MRALVVAALALAACQSRSNVNPPNPAPILLFNGAGTSPNDVAAIEAILDENQLSYATADSAQLDELSDVRLRGYRLLIVPGGNFIEMGDHLKPSTATRIHDAVQSGSSYLGICAGAFLAGTFPNNKHFDLASGAQFHFYSDEGRGIRKNAVAIASPGSGTLDQYWEDGPELSGWGDVVAKYPDGTPAVVEGNSGSGFAILSGIHPEAPASWRKGMAFNTSVSDDNAYAAKLIRAALERKILPHF